MKQASRRRARQTREPASAAPGNQGFGILQALVVLALIASAGYYLFSSVLNGTRFLASEIVSEDLSSIALEVRQSLRDPNYCSQMINVQQGGIRSNNGAEIQIHYPAPNAGTIIAEKGMATTHLQLSSVTLATLLHVGDPNGNQFLSEIRITAVRTGERFGGTITRAVPIYLLLQGNNIQKCLVTDYFMPVPAPIPMGANPPAPPYPYPNPTPSLTIEDNSCIALTGATPATQPAPPRFNPWPPLLAVPPAPPNPLARYCI